MQTGRGRGRGGAVRATRGGPNTGNGTILSFFSLTLLGKSKEYGELQVEVEVELLELQLQVEDLILEIVQSY